MGPTGYSFTALTTWVDAILSVCVCMGVLTISTLEANTIVVPCTAALNPPRSIGIQNGTVYRLLACDTQITFNSSLSLIDVTINANGGSAMPVVLIWGKSISRLTIAIYDIVNHGDNAAPTEMQLFTFDAAGLTGIVDRSDLRYAREVLIRIQNVTLDHHQGYLVNVNTSIVDSFVLILQDSYVTFAQLAQSAVMISAPYLPGTYLRDVNLTQIGGLWNVTAHSYGRTCAFWYTMGFISVQRVTYSMIETESYLVLSREATLNRTNDKYCMMVVDFTEPGIADKVSFLVSQWTLTNVMDINMAVEDSCIDVRAIFFTGTGVPEPPNASSTNSLILITNSNFNLCAANQGLIVQYRGFHYVQAATFTAENVTATMLARGESSDSARSAVLLGYVIIDQVMDWTFTTRNVSLTGALVHANKFESYSTSTACLLLLQNAASQRAVVDVRSSALDVTVDERTSAAVYSVNGLVVVMTQFAVSLSLIVFLSSDATGLSVTTVDSILKPHGTVNGANYSVLGAVLANYVAACIAVVMIQNNCTACSVSILRTHINITAFYVLPAIGSTVWPITDDIVCDRYASLNLTAFVVGSDPSLVLDLCLVPQLPLLKTIPTITDSIYGISTDPMQYRDMNLTVRDSWIRTPSRNPADSKQRSLGVTVISPPKYLTRMVLTVSNVSFVNSFTVSSLMVYAKTKATSITAHFSNVRGMQHWIETRIYKSNMSNFSMSLNQGHFVRNPFTMLSVFDASTLFLQPMTSPSNLRSTLAIDGSSTEDGVVSLFGQSVDMTGMSTASVQLGCNSFWSNMTPTSADTYRRGLAFAGSNRTKSFDDVSRVLNVSGACVAPLETPAPTNYSAPAPPPIASTRQSAVAVAALGVASSIPSIGATPSLVRLQTTVIAMQIRDTCSDDGEEDNTVVYGQSLFENPTGVAIPSLGDDYASAGGTVLMNIVLVVAVAVLAAVLRIAPKMWKQRDNLAILPWRAKLRIWCRYLPGSGVVLFSVFLQPSITCAVSIITSGSGNGIVIGLIGLAFFIGLLAYVSYCTIHQFPLTFKLEAPRDHHNSAHHRNHKRRDSIEGDDDNEDDRCCSDLVNFWDQFSSSPGEWVASRNVVGSGGRVVHRSVTSFEHRYSALYEPFRGGWHWYFVVDFVVAALSGIVSGMAGAPLPCDSVLWILVALCGVSAVGSIVIRPSAAPVENFLAIVVNSLGFISCVTIALSMDSISDDVALAQLVVSLVMSVIDAFRWFFGLFWQRNMRHRARRQLKDQLKSMFGDIQDVSRNVGRRGNELVRMLRGDDRRRAAANLRELVRQICDMQKAATQLAKTKRHYAEKRNSSSSSGGSFRQQAVVPSNLGIPSSFAAHVNRNSRSPRSDRQPSSSPPPLPVHRQFTWTQKQFSDRIDPNDL